MGHPCDLIGKLNVDHDVHKIGTLVRPQMFDTYLPASPTRVPHLLSSFLHCDAFDTNISMDMLRSQSHLSWRTLKRLTRSCTMLDLLTVRKELTPYTASTGTVVPGFDRPRVLSWAPLKKVLQTRLKQGCFHVLLSGHD